MFKLNMAVKYKMGYVALGILTVAILLASNYVYATADVVLNVGQTKPVSLGKDVEPGSVKSSDPEILR
ncbi:hypothetical protein HRbin05_00614 [archaeon HR05]|nr:hypothetical protein HRbin05_00614 [archaeon HR05]